eukprot:scaffold252819_cov14-Prasinocladus_malaysianus.AAC.1
MKCIEKNRNRNDHSAVNRNVAERNEKIIPEQHETRRNGAKRNKTNQSKPINNKMKRRKRIQTKTLGPLDGKFGLRPHPKEDAASS